MVWGHANQIKKQERRWGRGFLAAPFIMTEEKNKYRFHSSYKTLFRVRPVLYRFGDIPLPIPISLEALFVFVISFLALYPICTILEPVTQLFHLNNLIADMVFSGIITYYTKDIDPAGKFLPVYIYDILTHMTKERHRIWLGGNLDNERGKTYETFTVFVFKDKKPRGKVRLKNK